MSNEMTTFEKYRRRAERWMRRDMKWNMSKHQHTIRGHILSAVSSWRPWWNWGSPVMALVGTSFGGSASEPKPPTWWYRKMSPRFERFSGFPRHPLSTFEIVKDYDAFAERTRGLNEDEMYEWQAIGANQDGDLHLGHRYWGGAFYDLNRWDVPLLRRYLFRWRLTDWFGLRTWIYRQANHAAVYQRKPGSCAVGTPAHSGGYRHWRCEYPRRHEGEHRYGAYTWSESFPLVVHDEVRREAAQSIGRLAQSNGEQY